MKNCLDKLKKIIKLNNTLIISIAFSTLFFVMGCFTKSYNVSLFGILLFFIYTIIYSLINIKDNFLLLLINATIFTFVLSRPTISMFRGDIWWNFQEKSVWIALLSIFISLICIHLGHIYEESSLHDKIKQKIAEKLKRNKSDKEKTNINVSNNRVLKIVLIIMLVITFSANVITNIYKYVNMHDEDYELVYSNNDTDNDLPKIITILSTMYTYVVCFYLATFPPKKDTVITLFFYVISGLPMFLLGNRGLLISKILLVVVYLYIREITGDSIIRINKKIILGCIIVLPMIIIGLGAYNYTRSNQEIPKLSPVGLFVDFFYKQGTTFDTICQGFDHESELKNQEYVISYTFGNIIDYVKGSTISQLLFHTEDWGSGNNIIKATESNNMAHHLSYIVLGEESYLQGHGRGTSYILETYIDFGLFGVAIFSIIIGIYLAKVKKFKNYNFIIRAIFLIILTSLFVIPRNEATGFLTFLIEPQFIILLIIAVLSLALDNPQKI